jgi:hypothetical protein
MSQFNTGDARVHPHAQPAESAVGNEVPANEVLALTHHSNENMPPAAPALDTPATETSPASALTPTPVAPTLPIAPTLDTSTSGEAHSNEAHPPLSAIEPDEGPDPSNRLLEAALLYAERDWPVFPLHTPANGSCSCDKQDCDNQGKHPRYHPELLPNGHKNATTSCDLIMKWWTLWPDANIGIATGGAADSPVGSTAAPIVIDTDSDQGEQALLACPPLPETPCAVTGKGRHYYFQHPGTPLKSRARVLPDVDSRADGGAVVAPPSLHVSGEYYTWLIGPDEVELAPPPAWWMEKVNGSSNDSTSEPQLVESAEIESPRAVSHGAAQYHADGFHPAYSDAAFEDELAGVRAAASGTRNETTFKAAAALGGLVAAGALENGRVETALIEAAVSTGLSRDEAQKTVRSGLSSGMESPRAMPLSFTRSTPTPSEYSQSVTAGCLKEDVEHTGRGKENPPATHRQPAYILDTHSAAELMDKEIAPPVWAVEGLIVAGETLLAGPPKLGKSWMALNIALAVANGGVALGTIPVEEGDVLYLALEDTERRMQDRIRKIMKGQSAPQRLQITYDCKRLDEGGSEAIEYWLQNHPAARLVVVDTLKKVRPRRKRGANIYDEDYEHGMLLKALADRYGVAIVVVHHTNKTPATDPLEMVSGSTGLTGAVDSVLVLFRKRGQQEARLFTAGRDVEDQYLALEWSSDAGAWTLMGEVEDEPVQAISEQRAAILNALGQAAAPIGPKEIAESCGLKGELVRKLVRSMVEDGQIAAVGYGKYTLLTPDAGNTLHTLPTLHTGHTLHGDDTSDSAGDVPAKDGVDEEVCDEDGLDEVGCAYHANGTMEFDLTHTDTVFPLSVLPGALLPGTLLEGESVNAVNGVNASC